MAYRLFIRPRALRQLEALAMKHRRQIAARIDALAEDPRPSGAKKLSGSLELYRIRSGSYRIVYQISERTITVTVVRIAHRKEAYRGI
jgi:mRNA interferase RelE/StbE